MEPVSVTETITIQQAKEQGLSRFYTGQPCSRGHLAERLVSTGCCVECTKIHRMRWRKDNAEKIKKQCFEYYRNNTSKIREYTRKWKKENPDKKNANEAKRYTVKKLRLPCWITKESLFFIEEAYNLAQLRSNMTGLTWNVDHIVPLQGKTVSGLHCPENLQVITAKDNLEKSNKWDWDEQR